MGATTMITILSPHLDDAVLSCWHLLAGRGEVEAVNVFTATPDRTDRRPFWDEMTGSGDPVQRMSERRDEDRAALALAERSATNLDLLDEQYRLVNGAGPPPVLEAVRGVVDSSTVIYAPAALGIGLTDHGLVRDAALALREEGAAVVLYADLPHALRFGWPAWVTGEPEDPRIQPERWWRFLLEEAGLDADAVSPECTVLSDREFAEKRRALEKYRTQMPALERLADLDDLRYEVVLRLPEAAR